MGQTTGLAVAPQCLTALDRANDVRLARAQLKRRIRAGGLAVAEVLLTSPWQTRTMSVGELLTSQRGWGQVRTRRLLLSLAVPENKQIGTLTERQRLAIATVLAARTTGLGIESHRPEVQCHEDALLLRRPRGRAAG
jgi:hypothetical protein